MLLKNKEEKYGHLSLMARKAYGKQVPLSFSSESSIMPLNDFVYEACMSSDISFPDIPVRAVEHYAQCGEDIIVSSLIYAIASRYNVNPRDKLYMEIGGNHPYATSATYLLSKNFAMKGVIVEANEKLLDGLKRGRPNDMVVFGAVQDKDIDKVLFSVSNLSELSSVDRSFVMNWAGGNVGEASYKEVPALRIMNLFKNYVKGEDIIYLSIDVEGMDLVLLKDMDFKTYRPWVVQAEPSDHHIPGNSAAIFAYMSEQGYKLTARTAVNLIFTDAKL
jgi:hypothetical protein